MYNCLNWGHCLGETGTKAVSALWVEGNFFLSGESKEVLCLGKAGTKVASALWSKATLMESWPCAEDKLKRDMCAGDILRGLFPNGRFCESKASLEKFFLFCAEGMPRGKFA